MSSLPEYLGQKREVPLVRRDKAKGVSSLP